MGKFISQIIAGIAGLWLAILFVPGIGLRVLPDSSFFGFPLTKNWQVIVLLGIILGLLNFFIKPILKTITLPLRILTIGLFGIIINIVIIWAVDLLFKEITIPWFLPLLWTTLIVWALSILLSTILGRRKSKYN